MEQKLKLSTWRVLLIVAITNTISICLVANYNSTTTHAATGMKYSKDIVKIINSTTPCAEEAVVTSSTPPYGDFCETTVIGEKQPWNSRKMIISFALYSGTEDGKLSDRYFGGLKHNLKDAALYYPDWVTRVYTTGLSDEIIQSILSLSSSVEVLKCHGSPAARMMTRFLAFDDPTVYVTAVRDLDSRLSPRELLAVNQWRSSNFLFHVMRDHPEHRFPIMGGMFDMKRGALGNYSMTELVKKYLDEASDDKKGDQKFLQLHVWPLVRHLTMDHDIKHFRCRRKGAAICKDWPLGPNNLANNFYMGMAFTMEKTNTTGYECKLDCWPAV